MNTILCAINDHDAKLVSYKPDGKLTHNSVLVVKNPNSEFEKEIAKKIKEWTTPKSNLILIIPRDWITLKLTTIPSTNPVEITAMAEIQALKATPHAKEELVIQHQTIDSTQTESRILLLLLNTQKIELLLSEFKKISIYPKAIRLSSEVLAHWANQSIMSPKPDNMLWLHIDKHSSELLLLKNQKIIQSRVIEIEFKPELISQFTKSIYQTIEFFNRECGQDKNLNSIYITGPSALESDVQSLLSTNFQFEVKWIKQDALDASLSSYSAPCLTLVNFDQLMVDFSPPYLKTQHQTKLLQQKAFYAAILFSICLILTFLIIFTECLRAKKLLHQIENQIQSYSTRAQDLEIMKNKIHEFSKIQQSKGIALQAISLVFSHLSEDTMLKTISYDQKGLLTIKGTCSELSKVFELSPKLSNEKLFRSVKTKYARQVESSSSQKEVEFEINIEFNMVKG